MHQASENRNNGYHGTENCSSTPPTKAEQQTPFRIIQRQRLGKAQKGRGKAAVDVPG